MLGCLFREAAELDYMASASLCGSRGRERRHSDTVGQGVGEDRSGSFGDSLSSGELIP